MTAQTATIADFLLARYGEDEEAAEKWSRESTSECWNCGGNTLPQAPDALSPDRVLAECGAKRRIVEEHGNDYGDCATCSDGDDGACGDPECCGPASTVMKSWPCPTLRALAMPYADHPDFDPEWRA